MTWPHWNQPINCEKWNRRNVLRRSENAPTSQAYTETFHPAYSNKFHRDLPWWWERMILLRYKRQWHNYPIWRCRSKCMVTNTIPTKPFLSLDFSSLLKFKNKTSGYYFFENFSNSCIENIFASVSPHLWWTKPDIKYISVVTRFDCYILVHHIGANVAIIQ